MVIPANIPPEFATRAERRRWFTRADAEGLLDWIEDSGQRFLGLEVAERGADDTFVLLPESLDLHRQTDNFEAVRRGRVFLAEYDGSDLVFEPLWQDRAA